MVGDSPHSLIVNLEQSDAAIYLANRASNGFNCLWVETLCVPYTGGRPNGSLLNGTVPFNRNLANGDFDLTMPNSNYFSHVDTVLNMAATNNLLVLLDPCETGGLLTTMTSNGSNSCWVYGRFLGNRYKNFKNILWISGNDYSQAEWSIPTNDICVTALARGIASVDTNHIQTVELSADYPYPDSLSDTRWWPIISLNLVYDYSQTYAGCYRAYERTNRVPLFNGEQHYESEDSGNFQDNIETGTPLVLRHQEYWTMLSGATGQLYGNHYIWPFIGGWQDNLNTEGVQELQHNTTLFQVRPWWSLVPDTNHTVLTGGYGTFATNGLISTNDYATAARTTNGGLVIAYVPTSRTISVNMAKMSAPAIARWFDPTSGSFETIPGSPFTNSGVLNLTTPGNNTVGDSDWVLVLETNVPPIAVVPEFVQENQVTLAAPAGQVTAAYPLPQTAGNANMVIVGWHNSLAYILSVTDSAGNPYHAAIPSVHGNGLSQAFFFDLNIAGRSNAVTVKFSQPVALPSLSVLEYSGLPRSNSFGSGMSAFGRSAMASGGAVATTVNNEMLICAGYTTNQSMVSGAGFIQRTGAGAGVLVEDQFAPSPGTFRGTATLNSNSWVMQIVSFKAENPLIPPPITSLTRSNNNLLLKFSTVPGQTYLLEACTNLAAAWYPVGNTVSGTGELIQMTDTNAAGGPVRFYRVKVVN